ncbi:DUF4349 domain-containing protein [Niveibacterium terrae]|uniref:DUF4349 domain-containing protein n=1 Tax=Niveibacterium terrae TaxID=3373598 RepID=UPI003A90B408
MCLPRLLLVTLLTALLVAGCAKKDEAPGVPLSGQGGPASRQLAYTHSLSLDVAEDRIVPVFNDAQAKCREMGEGCEILESRLESGHSPSATLKFRVIPAGIPKLVAALGLQGEIAAQTTQAEDLAAPIADAARKQAMLETYRARLEALQARAERDVDALIKLNRELAQVQSDLETIAGERARLAKRVTREILTIAIAPRQNRSFWRPIATALSDFGPSLSQGVSTAITALAWLLPWSVVFGFAFLGVRWGWRRAKRTR